MSAGLVTLNAGFRRLKAMPVLFWPVAVAWTAVGGLGHGVATHFLDARLMFLLYPLGAAVLLWPVLTDTATDKLRGTINAVLLTAILWWTSWLGWHVAEGARAPGPYLSSAWVSASYEGPDPYAFDVAKGAAAGRAFAGLAPAAWIPHFAALSEAEKLRVPTRRRRYYGTSRRAYLTPRQLRIGWSLEPLIVLLTALVAVWPRRAERVLHFAQYLNPRRWRRASRPR